MSSLHTTQCKGVRGPSYSEDALWKLVAPKNENDNAENSVSRNDWFKQTETL